MYCFRNLPLIAASLHGRTHFDYSFFRSRNHMTFYVKMLGLLELLQPHVFRPEHKEALHDALTCYFDMFKVGVSLKKKLRRLFGRFYATLINCTVNSRNSETRNSANSRIRRIKF